MNSTNGELLKEVLVLEECLGNPKVAEKLFNAIPKWIKDDDANWDYLKGFLAPIRQAINKIKSPPKNLKGLGPKSK